MARWDHVDGFCTIGRLQTPSEREMRSILVRGHWVFPCFPNHCSSNDGGGEVSLCKKTTLRKWTAFDGFWESVANPGIWNYQRKTNFSKIILLVSGFCSVWLLVSGLCHKTDFSWQVDGFLALSP